MSDKLTIKQEAFAAAYVETSNASEAYRRAYDVNPDCKPNTVEKRACELLKNGKVAGRVDELRQRALLRHDITIDSLTEMLRQDRDLAHQTMSPAAAVSAVMGIAKLHGLIVEKRQNTNVNIDANQLSDRELEAIASGRGEAFASSAEGSTVTH